MRRWLSVLFVLWAVPVQAGTYWVSPTGAAANWAACQSATPLSGTAACTVAQANTNAVAGDTVYFRGGTYTFDRSGEAALSPSASGSCASAPCNGGVGASRITFAAHTGETPILIQANTTNSMYGLRLAGRNWIVVRGLTFKNFTTFMAFFDGGSSYNEIAYCSFTSDASYQTGGGVWIGGFDQTNWSTHNYLHHNYISTRRSANPCGEAVDLVRVGSSVANPFSADNNTTLESNYLEYGGHTLLMTNSLKNVIRDNTFHNEPWISGCKNFRGLGWSATSNYVGTGSKTFVMNTGFGISPGASVLLVESDGEGATMTGTVTSWSGSPNLTMVVNISGVTGSGTYERWFLNPGTSTTSLPVQTGATTVTLTIPFPGWDTYSMIVVTLASDYSVSMGGMVTGYNSGTGAVSASLTSSVGTGTYANWIVSFRNIPEYTTPSLNTLFSHRNIELGDENHYEDNLNLVEGNRIGFAGVNPGNGGDASLAMCSPGNIARYNDVYGAMISGIQFKWANAYGAGTGGVRNYAYNNTAYANGTGWNARTHGGMNSSYSGQGISQISYSGSSYNVIKNNIAYGNGQGDICYSQYPGNANCTPELTIGDTIAQNWTTNGSGQGNPSFINADLTQPLSQNLVASAHGYTTSPVPALGLAYGSGAINIPSTDNYGALTTTNGTGNSSTALVVADARYFQDGTRGSDLARGVTFFADWIAVGTVTNVAQIASVDSATAITLSTPLTWANGAPVWLYKKSDGAIVLVGSAPDYGAHELGGLPNAPSNVRVR